MVEFVVTGPVKAPPVSGNALYGPAANASHIWFSTSTTFFMPA